MAHPGGRPAKYKSAEELQIKIDQYFLPENICTRKVVVGKGDNQEVVKLPCPTITGLVMFLGYCDRQSFYDMEADRQFSDTIKKARNRIAHAYELNLHGPYPVGSIFALKNFGWSDKTEVEHSGKDFSVQLNFTARTQLDAPDQRQLPGPSPGDVSKK